VTTEPVEAAASACDAVEPAVAGDGGEKPVCPECGSGKVFRAGFRYYNGVAVQRWLCRDCGRRFSAKSAKRTFNGYNDYKRYKSAYNGYSKLNQICAIEAKNLEPTQPQSVGDNAANFDVKGKILQLMLKMQRDGYAPVTIKLTQTALKVLMERGANLADPESVKDVIAKQNWSANRRKNVINAYNTYLKFAGGTWEKPRVTLEQKIPFIPTEAELDALIAGSHRRLAAFLRLLKETAMRSGEAVRLEWSDIDFERRTITLNKPEKRSLPRMWRVSNELLSMLGALKKEDKRVFGDATPNTFKHTLQLTRKRLAFSLQNPRLLKISLHTFRHWKATMLYHQTRDPYYVKQFLGHKSFKNTEIYITVERTIFGEYHDEFNVKVASTPTEIQALLESGFEYVCAKDGLMFFRKRR
jgi:integrase